MLKKILPQTDSIHLDILTEYSIKGALGDLDNVSKDKIFTNTMMNKKEGLESSKK